jgi:NAD(P)-dependent dehydrogenase (short-subunit alcohol dehydrogenase family)
LEGCDHLTLVNNAGIIADGDDGILKISDEVMRNAGDEHAQGVARDSRVCAIVGESKSPRVINVSSGGGQLTGGADGWAPAYCISKTASTATSQLAAALPKLNSVCPGWVRTIWVGRMRRGQWKKARHDCVAGG